MSKQDRQLAFILGFLPVALAVNSSHRASWGEGLQMILFFGLFAIGGIILYRLHLKSIDEL